MRSILIPTLGAILGCSGVFAGVIRHVPNPKVTCTDKSIQAADFAAQATQCIETFCASTDRSTELHCGPAVLTINAPITDSKECAIEFQSIIKQCSSSDLVHGGKSQTEKVLYEITSVEGGHQHPSLNKRAKKPSKPKTPTKPKPAPKPKATPKPSPKPTPKASSKAAAPKPSSKAATGKPSLKTKSGTGLKTTNTRSSSRRTSSSAPCSAPTYTLKAGGKLTPLAEKQKPKSGGTTKPKTGGKAARDVGSDGHNHDHKLLLRTRSPSPGGSPGGGAPVCVNVKAFYQPVVLSSKAMWWTFMKKTGWNDIKDQEPEAYAVLNKMTLKGKFDVVKIRGGALSVVGAAEGETNIKDYAKQGGKYVLCNGGFFVMPQQFPEFANFAVGETSITTNQYPIDARYKNYFKTITGDDGSNFQSGPSLRGRVPLERPEFKWNAENSNIPGSIAHCTNANERLAIAIRGNDKFIFAYTAATRNDGVTCNQLRDVIDIFFQKYERAGIASTSQTVNLDGGGSIYLSWNYGNEEFVIAAGSRGGTTRGKAGISSPRPVKTVLKIT